MKKFTEENECYNYILKTKFQELVSDSSYVGGFEDGFNHALEQLALHNVSKSLPTDDELDEAAVEYCKSVYSDRPEMDDYQDGVEAFDAGAIWMKERLV